MSKQREEFEAWFKKTWNGIDLTQTIGDDMAFKLDDKSEYFEDCVQHSWGAWQQAQKVAVPDGFVVVPIEPTSEILDALETGFEFAHSESCFHPYTAYRAMIETQEDLT